MVGYNEIGHVPAEQLALLKSRNFSISPLSTAGHLDFWRLLSLTWQPILIFVFTLLLLTAVDFRYSGEQTVVALHYLGVFVLLLPPLLALGLLAFGVGCTTANARVRMSAVVYWTWWPFWRVMLCIGAALVGSWAGNHLWYRQLFPHTRMQKLQAYNDIDARVSGIRLQDAGVVAFNSTAGVDRSRSGCLKNGATYCVAPIVLGGELLHDGGVSGAGEPGVQDLFMSGMNCCNCPGEFRCGNWNVPKPLGGFRVLDTALEGYYGLAAEDWATTYGQAVGHPIFFEWVADPVAAYHELRDRGMRLKALALVAIPAAIILVTVALNGLLAFFCHLGLAAPVETPLPPPGLGRALSAHFMPHMHRRYLQKQEEEEQMDWNQPYPKYVMM